MPRDFIIRINRNEHEAACSICGQPASRFVGPELFLLEKGDAQAVCDECGQEHAPTLYSLVILGKEALTYGADHYEQLESFYPPQDDDDDESSGLHYRPGLN